MQRLENAAELKSLNLAGTRVTPGGLKSLAKLPRLRTLNVTGLQLGETGLTALSNLKRVKDLTVDKAAVSGKPIALHSMQHLQQLRIQGSGVISAELLKELRSVLPQAEIMAK